MVPRDASGGGPAGVHTILLEVVAPYVHSCVCSSVARDASGGGVPMLLSTAVVSTVCTCPYVRILSSLSSIHPPTPPAVVPRDRYILLVLLL